MTSQTKIFRQLAGEFAGRVPCIERADASVLDAIGRMGAAKAACLVVVDDDRKVIGILTEQDVVRRIAFAATPETPLASLMTTPVRTIAGDDHLYRAIARMRRFGHRHMPVVNRRGALTGLLDLHAAMAVASEQMMDQIDRLTQEGSLDGLKQVKAAQVDVADELFADNVPVPEIQSLLSHINNDIYDRVLRANLRDMSQGGWGAAPVPFAVIVMGSGGREENFLFPDQDNGFILTDYPDDEHATIDPFFIELAERMNRDLDAVGIPYCKGHVMARNPLWRKTISQWRAQITGWGRKRDHVALRLADIFFDFQPVHGEAELASKLRRHVTRLTKGNPAFLQAMCRDESEEHRVALGLFGRLLTERTDPAHKGEVNLKITGTLPLVEAVRLLASRHGVAKTSTVDRLDGLRAKDMLGRDEHAGLRAAADHVTRLLLRHQIADFKAGRPVTNYVPPKAISRHDRALLVRSFRAIKELRGRVRSELTGELF